MNFCFIDPFSSLLSKILHSTYIRKYLLIINCHTTRTEYFSDFRIKTFKNRPNVIPLGREVGPCSLAGGQENSAVAGSWTRRLCRRWAERQRGSSGGKRSCRRTVVRCRVPPSAELPVCASGRRSSLRFPCRVQPPACRSAAELHQLREPPQLFPVFPL